MEVIRAYALRKTGHELRGFHWYMKRENITYYDILELDSP